MTKKEQASTTIKDCQFTGVHYDAEAVKSINNLIAAYSNAIDGLNKIGSILKVESVGIGTAISINQSK